MWFRPATRADAFSVVTTMPKRGRLCADRSRVRDTEPTPIQQVQLPQRRQLRRQQQPSTAAHLL